MDKKDWEDIVKEPVSEELRHKTMVRARQELEQLEQGTSVFSLKWLIPVIPGLAALLFFINNRSSKNEPSLLASDEELLNELAQLEQEDIGEFDSEFFSDLDFYDDFEFLEEWDGEEEV